MGIDGAQHQPGIHYEYRDRQDQRSCDLLAFDGGDAFLLFAGTSNIASALSSHFMPHALQTQREFWLSSQPLLLENFLRQTAFATKIPDAATATAAGNLVHAAGPGNIVTLDPYAISAATLF